MRKNKKDKVEKNHRGDYQRKELDNKPFEKTSIFLFSNQYPQKHKCYIIIFKDTMVT